MLTLRTFTAKILTLNQILVQWSIDSTDDDISKFRFTLARSNSPGGPFERIVQDFINDYQFIDETPQMKSNWRKFYYRLTITDVRGGDPLVGPVASLKGDPDYFLLDIRSKNDLYLKRFVGVPAGVLIARTFGQRCGQCWDQVKSRSSSSSCHTCFSTGFVGGFFPQINVMANFSPNPETIALLEMGEQQPNQTNLWMNFYPELSPRDIIVEFREQKRWRVASLGKTERLRVTSRQIASLREINRSDVEYKIPVVPYEPEKEVFLGFRPPEGSGLL